MKIRSVCMIENPESNEAQDGASVMMPQPTRWGKDRRASGGAKTALRPRTKLPHAKAHRPPTHQQIACEGSPVFREPA